MTQETCLQGFQPGPTQNTATEERYEISETGSGGLSREKKDVDQLHGHSAADLGFCFRICKKQVFS